MPFKVGRVKKPTDSGSLFAATEDTRVDEIVLAPRRITRSRSRENKVHTDFFKLEASKYSKSSTSGVKSSQGARRDKPMKTAAKNTKKISKAAQLQTSDSEWEDQLDEPQNPRKAGLLQPLNPPAAALGLPGLTKTPRLQAAPPGAIARSPIHHVASPVTSPRPSRAPAAASGRPGPRRSPRLQAASSGTVARSPIHHVASPAASARPSRTRERLQAFRYSPPAEKPPSTRSTASSTVVSRKTTRNMGNSVTSRGRPAPRGSHLQKEPENTDEDYHSTDDCNQPHPPKTSTKLKNRYIKIQQKTSSSRLSRSSGEDDDEEIEVTKTVREKYSFQKEFRGASDEDVNNNSPHVSHLKNTGTRPSTIVVNINMKQTVLDRFHVSSSKSRKTLRPSNVGANVEADDLNAARPSADAGSDVSEEKYSGRIFSREDAGVEQHTGVKAKSTVLSGANASIFDPDVSLSAIETPHPDRCFPAASSTRQEENSRADDLPTDDIDIPQPSLPPKTQGRKRWLQKKVNFRNTREYFSLDKRSSRRKDEERAESSGGSSPEEAKVEPQSTSDSEINSSSDTSSSSGDTQDDQEVDPDRESEDTVEVSHQSLPSKIPVRRDTQELAANKYQFKSRSLHPTSLDGPTPAKTENVTKDGLQKTQEQSATTSSGFNPPEDETSIMNISQLANITFRSHSRASRSTNRVPEIPSSGLQLLTIQEQFLENIARASRNSPPPVREPKRNPVVMPHSSSEWATIKDSLKTATYSINSLKTSILRYSGKKSVSMKFRGLENCLSSLDLAESRNFFFQVLAAMKNLALQLPALMIKEINVCKRQNNSITQITQEQAGCLLANGFLCTFPGDAEGSEEYGGRFLSFWKLFEAFQDSGDDRHERNEIVKQKIKCFVTYFSIIIEKPSNNTLTFERIHIAAVPTWWTLKVPLRAVNIMESTDCREEGVEVLDTEGVFGGDLFGFQIDEEQINFLLHPELMVARLFVEPVGESEALFFWGAQQYSVYDGSGKDFKCRGPCKDAKPRHFAYVRRNDIEDGKMFTREDVISELEKMFVVFETVDRNDEIAKMVTIKATKQQEDRGDLAMKFIVFLMVASYVGISGTFCLRDDMWRDEIRSIQQLLIKKKIDIRTIFGALCEYGEKQRRRSMYFLLKQKFKHIGE
ncbi:poly(ADP-ribose) glycohydrolase isoform X2 [Diachasma alloeum]|uniref:poly(ADP-ribose) glycohydrolase isoform X2 n=1 Tax=Diachasma alloeum TaxID=454923 RepID=UPI0007384BF9|nr:poly(ADP-ribose) glycohydrolase isoform X2 [Diachasma alloeum]